MKLSNLFYFWKI